MSVSSTSVSSTSSITPVVPAFSPIQAAFSPYVEPLFRVTTGLFLMPHGAQKLLGLFGGYGLAGTEQFFVSKLGLPPHVALLAGVIELFGGFLLAVGLATRIAAGFVVGLMAVAISSVHLANGFFWTDGGYEYPLMWGILALGFVVRGGGRLSVDSLIGYEI